MTEEEFITELTKLNIEVTPEKLDQLKEYASFLLEYNQHTNLTAIRDINEVYLKHFYDSLTISKIIDLNNYNSLCDIGTGAGFPGIVLKIFYPNLKVTLIDSLNKRINFLNDVIQKLKLTNIEAIHCRIEEYAKINREKYDIVTARAVAPLNILLEYAIPLVKSGKYFIAMKGKEENAELYHNAIKILQSEICNICKFKLPIENRERTLYKIKKNNKTSNKYLMKYIEIKKKSL